MTFNAAALRVMADKGLSLSDVAEIAQAMETRRDPTAAARQAKCRARRDMSRRDVTRDTVSPNESILTPSATPIVVSSETTPPVLKPEHVVEVWNDRATDWGLKQVQKLTPQRCRKLTSRIRQNSIDEFTEAISAIGRSPFLRGENDRGWRADFDWMLEPRNFTKLIEGNYDR